MSTAVIPQSVVEAAQRTQAKWGPYASVTCAQWALESAWGAHMSGKNNPFGIKSRPGEPCTSCTTWEVLDGVRRSMPQNFRDFASMDEAFDQHGKLLATGSAYALARSFVGHHDANGYAHALTGHYATDPQYGAKLVSIMKAHELYQFDGVPAPAARPASIPPHIGVVQEPHPGFWGRFWAALTKKAA